MASRLTLLANGVRALAFTYHTNPGQPPKLISKRR